MEMSQLNKKDSDDYLGFATVVNKIATILNLANCQRITSNVWYLHKA